MGSDWVSQPVFIQSRIRLCAILLFTKQANPNSSLWPDVGLGERAHAGFHHDLVPCEIGHLGSTDAFEGHNCVVVHVLTNLKIYRILHEGHGSRKTRECFLNC